jgi:hypothetical protein
MEGSGQLHTPAALPWERKPVPTEQKDGWPDHSTRLGGFQKTSLVAARIRTPDRPASSPVTIPTGHSDSLYLATPLVFSRVNHGQPRETSYAISRWTDLKSKSIRTQLNSISFYRTICFDLFQVILRFIMCWKHTGEEMQVRKMRLKQLKC